MQPPDSAAAPLDPATPRAIAHALVSFVDFVGHAPTKSTLDAACGATG
jgi:hypothetical protein